MVEKKTILNEISIFGTPSLTSIVSIDKLDPKHMMDNVILASMINDGTISFEIFKSTFSDYKNCLFVSRLLFQHSLSMSGTPVSSKVEEILIDLVEDKKIENNLCQKKIFSLVVYYYNQKIPVAHSVFSDRKKSTLLHFVCKKKFHLLYQVLVELFFCDVDAKDSKGKIPSQYF